MMASAWKSVLACSWARLTCLCLAPCSPLQHTYFYPLYTHFCEFGTWVIIFTWLA